MKNIKKAISLLLCVIMVMSSVITAFASPFTSSATNLSMSIDKATAEIGDTITVKLSTKGMTVDTFGFGVIFNTSLVELQSFAGAIPAAPEAIVINKVSGYPLEQLCGDGTADVAQANTQGRFARGFAGSTNVQYKADADFLTLTFKAIADGTVEFGLVENSGGADGKVIDDADAIKGSVTINGAPTPTYTATVDPTTKTFTSAQEGYAPIAAQTFTIENTGTGELANLTVSLNGGDYADFVLDKASLTTPLATSGTTTFTVRPHNDLLEGTYTTTARITATGMTDINIPISFEVTSAPLDTYTITYNANSGSGAQAADTATEGTAFTLPATSTFTPPKGYIFEGWSLSSDGAVITSHTFTAPTTVYAIWKVASLTGHATINDDGTPQYGETLTALLTSDNNTGTISYQWFRDVGGTQTNIGTDSNTYTIVADDIGADLGVNISSSVQTGSVSSNAVTPQKANATAPSTPTTSSVTHNSITVNPVSGAEYSKDNGATWQNSGVFDSLTAETEYQIVIRLKETLTHNASPNSTTKSVTTSAVPANPLVGTAEIDNTTPEVGQTLTATLNGATSSNLVYQWKRDGVSISGETASTYQVTNADIGKTITVTISATDQDGDSTSASTAAVPKLNQSAPAAPTLASKTDTTITVNAISGAEYAIDGGAWQDSTTFAGLDPNTAYDIAARLKETSTHNESASSGALSVTTDKADLAGSAKITGTAKFGQTLIAVLQGGNSSNLNYQWIRAGAPIVGATSNNYILVEADIGSAISVEITAGDADMQGSKISSPTAEVAKADAPATPAKPVLGSKDDTSITVTAVAGQEYRIGATGTWQDTGVFATLTEDTTYNIYTRVKETSTTKPSAISSALSVKTDVTPAVLSVSIDPSSAGVELGNSKTFTPNVSGKGAYTDGVTWDIVTSGIDAGTTIDATGKLTVAAGETQTTIIVRATSVGTPVKTATATVAVIDTSKTNQDLMFASASMNKTTGTAPFTNALTGAVTTPVYTSSNTAVATVNSATGEVSIVGVGTTVISVTAPAGTVDTVDYNAGVASYTLKVSSPTTSGTVSGGGSGGGGGTSGAWYPTIGIGGSYTTSGGSGGVVGGSAFGTASTFGRTYTQILGVPQTTEIIGNDTAATINVVGTSPTGIIVQLDPEVLQGLSSLKINSSIANISLTAAQIATIVAQADGDIVMITLKSTMGETPAYTTVISADNKTIAV